MGRLRDGYALLLSPSATHFKHVERFVENARSVIKGEVHILGLFSNSDREQVRTVESFFDIVRFLSVEDERRIHDLYWVEGRSDIDPFAAYAQLFAPYYFLDVDDFLYVEVDQMIRRDLSELFYDVRERQAALAAVPNMRAAGAMKSGTKPFQAIWGDRIYFNTGVLYVNTRKWREAGCFDRCWEEVALQKRNEGARLIYYAEGALNNALCEDILPIEHKYNFQNLGNNPCIPKRVIEKACVLHWNGERKPWLKNGLYKDYYYGIVGPNAFLVSAWRRAECIVRKVRRFVIVKMLLKGVIRLWGLWR